MAPRKGQRHSGQFKPGQSGNPGGRPKLADGWREKLREDPELQDLALRLAKGKLTAEHKHASPEMVRYLLDQGFGRAPQKLEHTGKDGDELVVGLRFEDAMRRLAGLTKDKGEENHDEEEGSEEG